MLQNCLLDTCLRTVPNYSHPLHHYIPDAFGSKVHVGNSAAINQVESGVGPSRYPRLHVGPAYTGIARSLDSFCPTQISRFNKRSSFQMPVRSEIHRLL